MFLIVPNIFHTHIGQDVSICENVYKRENHPKLTEFIHVLEYLKLKLPYPYIE